jgi:DNA-binding MarR family transcriptional regulator
MKTPATPPHLTFLLQDAARLLARYFDQRARAALGLTRAQCRLLVALSRHGPLAPMALAELLDTTPMGLTGLIDRMVEKNLVERAPNPDDRRSYTVLLSAKAERAIAGIFVLRDALEDELLTGFSARQQALLVRMLGKLRLNLLAAAADSGQKAAAQPAPPAANRRRGTR